MLVLSDPITIGDTITIDFQSNAGPRTIFFRSLGGAILRDNAETQLAAGLLPSLREGSGLLTTTQAVDATFRASLATIQEIYRCWDQGLRPAVIQAPLASAASTPGGNGVAAFFSGGVDSFYTLLKHEQEITDLVFVHGFDVALADSRLRRKASAMVRDVAEHFGKNLIEIETNIRELLDACVDWGERGHGAALAAVGHLLSARIRRLYIPATHTYADLIPWGSHPILDPLWSSGHLTVVHDGCEATRPQKIALLATQDIALRNLRVCWENPGSEVNCGRCEKCLRTMINLQINGALERCTTFERPLEIANVLRLRIDDAGTRAFVQENLDRLEQSDPEGDLTRALRRILRPRQGRMARLMQGLHHLSRRFT